MKLSEQELNAKESICWKCKHGLCISESELRSVYGPGEEKAQNIFSSETDEEPASEEDMQELIIPSSKVRTICFWKPEFISVAPPIMLSLVNECNRFEEK